MRISKILPILLVGVGSVLADGISINGAITAIQNATSVLSNTVAAWNGDILGAVPIITQSTSLLKFIDDGIAIAKASAILSETEAVSVGIATTTLATTINALLVVVVDAKAKFDRVLLTPVILLNLEQEKSATSLFSSAVVGKLSEGSVATGQQLFSQITAAFGSAIGSYGGGYI
ncbi:hypothetical protein SLS53_005291 [Cytospora paraplurivora]|uniref:Uncharacterized protein n=1 Tax=Cytospora paraplurivora TaxID=2898453 RepID=A0AAN9U5I5_9PEZI